MIPLVITFGDLLGGSIVVGGVFIIIGILLIVFGNYRP